MSLAKKIALLREEKEWSQAQLGKALGLNQRYISLWETGKNVPQLENLVKLSRIFDVSLDYLVFDNVPRSGTSKIKDIDLYEHFWRAEELPEKDRNNIKVIVSAYIFRHRVQSADAEMEEINAPKPSPKPEQQPLRKRK